jgi:hypothetical protein
LKKKEGRSKKEEGGGFEIKRDWNPNSKGTSFRNPGIKPP